MKPAMLLEIKYSDVEVHVEDKGREKFEKILLGKKEAFYSIYKWWKSVQTYLDDL